MPLGNDTRNMGGWVFMTRQLVSHILAWTANREEKNTLQCILRTFKTRAAYAERCAAAVVVIAACLFVCCLLHLIIICSHVNLGPGSLVMMMIMVVVVNIQGWSHFLFLLLVPGSIHGSHPIHDNQPLNQQKLLGTQGKIKHTYRRIENGSGLPVKWQVMPRIVQDVLAELDPFLSLSLSVSFSRSSFGLVHSLENVLTRKWKSYSHHLYGPAHFYFILILNQLVPFSWTQRSGRWCFKPSLQKKVYVVNHKLYIIYLGNIHTPLPTHEPGMGEEMREM